MRWQPWIGDAAHGRMLLEVPSNRQGILTGKHHFGGTEIMKELLENEGAVIEDDVILNFNELFWDPVSEL